MMPYFDHKYAHVPVSRQHYTSGKSMKQEFEEERVEDIFFIFIFCTISSEFTSNSIDCNTLKGSIKFAGYFLAPFLSI